MSQEKRPRFTYAIQHFNETGAMRAPYQICKGFRTAGWETTVLTAANEHAKLNPSVWDGIPVRSVDGRSRRLRLLKMACQLLGKRPRHLVMTTVWEWQNFGLLVAKILFKSPFVVRLDTFQYLAVKSPLARIRERIRYGITLNHANMILAETPNAYSAAVRYFSSDKVKLVPSGLWQRDLQLLESKWVTAGFQPRREKVILYAGRLLERKHVQDLITSFSYLSSDFPEWILEIRSIPASDAYKQRINTLIAQLDCTDKVHFLSGLSGEALYRRYRETSIFALPSEGEGMPTTITEAMYFGGAIVAGISGALPHQLDDGRCGCLHDAGDLEALTDHLRTLMASESLRETYMARARVRMLSLFVWERYFPELEIQFRQLVEI